MSDTSRPAAPEPFCREAGTGPAVICLHSNASSSSQWRTLTERLSPAFRILAPDSLGAGRSPAWPAAGPVGLRDEIALLAPVFERAGPRFMLVGHSYGAAIALVAALLMPERVAAVAVFEPTLFGLLEEEAPGQDAANGIRQAAADAAAAIAGGDPDAAAERFIDYWIGSGTWRRTPEPRRQAIAASMAPIGGWSRALFEEPTRLRDFHALAAPVLYLVGGRSPASSRGVARLLIPALHDVEAIVFDELGHMGPITDPDVVNAEVERFLRSRHP